MLDKQMIDKLGTLMASLQNQFNLPTYELVMTMEKIFPRRPWKEILHRTQKKNEDLLEDIFGKETE